MTITETVIDQQGDFLSSYNRPLPLQQSWGYGEVLRQVGAGVERLRLKDGQGTAAWVQFIHRRYLGCIHLASGLRGPLWTMEDPARQQAVLNHLAKRAKRWCRRFLLLSPTGAGQAGMLRQAGLRRLVTPTASVWADLSPDEAGLRLSLNGKWRNMLVKAEKAGLRVEPLGLKPKNYAWLLEEEAKQRRDRRYIAAPADFTVDYQRLSGEAQPLFGLVAYQGRERLAGQLFLRHGSSASYHIGWTGDRSVPAHHLLLWHAMLALKQQGVQWLDLGGVDTGPGKGLARFKLGAGEPIIDDGMWG